MVSWTDSPEEFRLTFAPSDSESNVRVETTEDDVTLIVSKDVEATK